MSKKKLLLKMLAISCLATGGISATEKPKSKSVDNKAVVTKVETKEKGNFFTNNKSQLLSGGLGATVGTLGGIGVGYWLGGRDPKAQLAQANKDKQALQTEISELNSKIAQKDAEITKYKNSDATIADLEKQLSDLKTQLETEKNTVKQRDQKITELNNMVTQKKNDIECQRKLLEENNKKIEELNNLLSEKGGNTEKQLAKLIEENTKKNNEILALKQQINELASKNNTLDDTNKKLNESIDKTKKELECYTNAIETAKCKFDFSKNGTKKLVNYLKCGKVLKKALCIATVSPDFLDSPPANKKEKPSKSSSRPIGFFNLKCLIEWLDALFTSEERQKLGIRKDGLTLECDLSRVRDEICKKLSLTDKEKDKDKIDAVNYMLRYYIYGMVNASMGVEWKLEDEYCEIDSEDLEPTKNKDKTWVSKFNELCKSKKLPELKYTRLKPSVFDNNS